MLELAKCNLKFSGHKLDYDRWEAMGNYGWSYRDVLPYFKKSEDFREESQPEDSTFHSKGGPLAVEKAGFHSPLAELFLNASRKAGLAVNGDFCGSDQLMGVGLRHQATLDGVRVSSANAFLPDASERPNLTVILESTVQRILFGGAKENIARGVLVKTGGRLVRIFARREVILSAGAVASPQLLMLSGIGPRDHLEVSGDFLKTFLVFDRAPPTESWNSGTSGPARGQ